MSCFPGHKVCRIVVLSILNCIWGLIGGTSNWLYIERSKVTFQWLMLKSVWNPDLALPFIHFYSKSNTRIDSKLSLGFNALWLTTRVTCKCESIDEGFSLDIGMEKTTVKLGCISTFQFSEFGLKKTSPCRCCVVLSRISRIRSKIQRSPNFWWNSRRDMKIYAENRAAAAAPAQH